MGWLITLGILLLLGILPLGVSAVYDEDGLLVRIIAGPLKIQVLPASGKKNKPKKEKKPETAEKKQKPPKKKTSKAEEKTDSSGKPEKKAKKSGGPITDFLPLVGVLLKFLDGFRRKSAAP